MRVDSGDEAMERKIEASTESTSFRRVESGSAFYARSRIAKVMLRPDADVRRARLAHVIVDEIVPRLKTLHHGIREATPLGNPKESEIAEFGILVMASDIGAASVYFDKMIAKGHSLDTLFVHFLEPTARYLGELWNQDRCDFIDVTIGVSHLQELLTIFGSKAEIAMRDVDHRALLITTPGEKHLFGVDMVAQFMREAGWDVSIEAGSSPKVCAERVAQEWFGVVGVTLSDSGGLEAAARVIDAVRRGSANANIPVMVGGPVFTENPDLVAQVGADAAAPDAPTAVILAKKLLLARAARK
jgi:methanogenic corrinoid protein MtbC1